jgi:hypothetical protein
MRGVAEVQDESTAWVMGAVRRRSCALVPSVLISHDAPCRWYREALDNPKYPQAPRPWPSSPDRLAVIHSPPAAFRAGHALRGRGGRAGRPSPCCRRPGGAGEGRRRSPRWIGRTEPAEYVGPGPYPASVPAMAGRRDDPGRSDASGCRPMGADGSTSTAREGADSTKRRAHVSQDGRRPCGRFAPASLGARPVPSAA